MSDSIEYGVLKIMRYNALNGTWYRIAKYKDTWYFVHVSRKKLSSCPCGYTRNGKKYYLYKGCFIISSVSTIDII